MQPYKFDNEQLIVSWNRYEQGLMKKYLMNCAYSNDWFCFGNENEVKELYGYLVKHGILPQVNYKYTNFQQLVFNIKDAIKNRLQQYQGHPFANSTPYSINNDNETKFLTSFAMAVQDTKIRGAFIPEHISFLPSNNTSNAWVAQSGNLSVSLAKARLFSLATQLTRIGLNCKTTVSNSKNLRSPTNGNSKRTINFIDTNNFLYEGSLNMQKLDIGMEPFWYYLNLYRKLFDLALKREWEQKMAGKKMKIPRFLIPLTHYWDKSHQTVNPAIKQALERLFGERYNQSQTYGDLVAVDIIDFNNSNGRLFQNWQHGRVLNQNSNIELFNNSQYEEYAIGAGDHYTFIGNECMDCWRGGTASSHEAFAMKTNFPKFYGQNEEFAKNNGYYIINPNLFKMPTNYRLHMNYKNDEIVNIDEQQQSINNFVKYGIQSKKQNILS